MNKNIKESRERIKDFFEDRKLTKYSAFIIITFTIMYIIFLLLKNLGVVIPAVGGAVGWIIGLFTSFILGLVIAYIVDPLVEFIARKLHMGEKKFGRPISVLIAFLLILAVIALLLYGFMAMILGKLVIGNIAENFDKLVATLKSYEQSIQTWAANLPGENLSSGVKNLVDGFMKWLTSNFSGSSIVNTVSGLVGNVINIVIGVFFSVYLLLYKDTMIDLWNRFLDLIIPRRKETLNNALAEIDTVTSSFIKGIAIDASIIAVLSSLGLTIAGVKFAVFLGLFAGVCNVIPYFGPFLGMVPAFLVACITAGPTKGIIAVAILFCIQQLDANLIYPKVVGNSTGLHPLYVLLAVTVGGGVGGLLGMVLAVPVAGVLKLFAYKWADRHKEKRGDNDLPDEGAQQD